jgi:hypothetical protein
MFENDLCYCLHASICLGLIAFVNFVLARIYHKYHEKIAKFDQPASFKTWFRTYMRIAHDCDQPILDSLWNSDNGSHGKRLAVLYDELIADVSRFLKARDFECNDSYYEKKKWRAKHNRWPWYHPDGRGVTIEPEGTFPINDAPSFRMTLLEDNNINRYVMHHVTIRNIFPKKEFHKFRETVFEELWAVIVEKRLERFNDE